MTARIDEISPPYIGEDRIVLTLADPEITLLAFVPFQIDVDYSETEPEGITLPMELVMQGPRFGQEKRRLFKRSRPDSVLLVPESRGQHFILLRELYHNRWQGRLIVEVEGEDLQTRYDERTL